MTLMLNLLFWVPAAFFLSGLSSYILGLATRVPVLQRVAQHYPAFHGGGEVARIGPGLILSAVVMAVGAGAAWAHLIDGI